MADFQAAFDYMLAHEDPRRSGRITRDLGGLTRFGIAQKFHPDLPEEFYDEKTDLESVFLTARAIYQSDYWNKAQLAGLVDPHVACKLFDMCVNPGAGEAARLAQRAANGLLLGRSSAPAIDGAWGPHTISALNGCPPDNLLETLCNLSKIYYYDEVAANPHQEVNLRGWLKRAECRPDRLCDEHSALSSQHSALSQSAKAGGQ